MPEFSQPVVPTNENIKEIFNLLHTLLYSKGCSVENIKWGADFLNESTEEVQRQIDYGIKINAIRETSPGIYDVTDEAAQLLLNGVS